MLGKRVAGAFLTIFDLCNVADYDLGHGDLDDLAATDHGKLLLLLDAALEAPELLLLAPVVERRHQHHADDGQEDGGSFDPARLRLVLVLHAARRLATVCRWGGERINVRLCRKVEKWNVSGDEYHRRLRSLSASGGL